MFFSVTSATKIGSKVYKPCICYSLTKDLTEVVNDLAEKGQAKIYADRVFFQNGKVIERKEVKEEIKKTVKIKKETVKKEPVLEKEIENEFDNSDF